MNELTLSEQIKSLENDLKNFGFNPKLKVYYTTNADLSNDFVLCTYNESGTVHGNKYSYKEMKAYLLGYYNAINRIDGSESNNLL